MAKTAILTDSSATFSKQELLDYPDLYMMPINLLLPDGNEVEDDEDKISYDRFYKILERQPIKTSQISMGQMMVMWDKLLDEYDNVVFLGLSKGLSGQHNTMTLLSHDEKYEGKVTIIDTDAVTQMLNKMVLDAYEKIKNGLPIEQLQARIDFLKTQYTAFIVPKSLDALCRGGRIRPAAAKLANLLKITPILICNGEIDKFEKTRTFSKAINRAICELKATRNDTEITLVSAKTDAETKKLIIESIKKNGFTKINECSMPRVIAAHTGADAFGLIGWNKGV